MSDAAVRNNPELRGRAAYEASLALEPNYHDGSPRPSWEKLSEIARQSWERVSARVGEVKP